MKSERVNELFDLTIDSCRMNGWTNCMLSGLIREEYSNVWTNCMLSGLIRAE